MHYVIYSVGKTKQPQLAALEQEYTSRLQHDHSVELRYVKDNTRLDEALAGVGGPVIALDEGGKEYSTQEFNSLMFSTVGDTVIFVIGDTDGLTQQTRNVATYTLALSRMTFTHEMARVLLLEQLYRSHCIQIGHPYHRE